MTLISDYIDLFVRGEKSGGNVRVENVRIPTYWAVASPCTRSLFRAWLVIECAAVTSCMSADDPLSTPMVLMDFHSFIHCRHLYSASSSGATQKRFQPQRGRIMLF